MDTTTGDTTTGLPDYGELKIVGTTTPIDQERLPMRLNPVYQAGGKYYCIAGPALVEYPAFDRDVGEGTSQLFHSPGSECFGQAYQAEHALIATLEDGVQYIPEADVPRLMADIFMWAVARAALEVKDYAYNGTARYWLRQCVRAQPNHAGVVWALVGLQDPDAALYTDLYLKAPWAEESPDIQIQSLPPELQVWANRGRELHSPIRTPAPDTSGPTDEEIRDELESLTEQARRINNRREELKRIADLRQHDRRGALLEEALGHRSFAVHLEGTFGLYIRPPDGDWYEGDADEGKISELASGVDAFAGKRLDFRGHKYTAKAEGSYVALRPLAFDDVAAWKALLQAAEEKIRDPDPDCLARLRKILGLVEEFWQSCQKQEGTPPSAQE